MGMAWIQERAAAKGSKLLLFPARQLERATAVREAAELWPGDRMPIQVRATIIPRFGR
jgi:hypothetical protein